MIILHNNKDHKKHTCIFDCGGGEETSCSCYLSPLSPPCPYRDEIPEPMEPEDVQKIYEANVRNRKEIDDFLTVCDDETKIQREERKAWMKAACYPDRVTAEYESYVNVGQSVPYPVALAMKYVVENRDRAAAARFDSQPTRCGHSLRTVHEPGWRGDTPLRTPDEDLEEDAQ